MMEFLCKVADFYEAHPIMTTLSITILMIIMLLLKFNPIFILVIMIGLSIIPLVCIKIKYYISSKEK